MLKFRQTVVEALGSQRPATVKLNKNSSDSRDVEIAESGKHSRDKATPFRPIKRPPMARLVVLDDGRCRGRQIRLSNDCTTIGRRGADVEVRHDHEISDHHAQIVRRWKDGRYRWFLEDLNSTNGTFVRIAQCRLRNEQNFLVGSRKFSLQLANQPGHPERNIVSVPIGTRSTSLFQPAIIPNRNSAIPKLVEQSRADAPLVLPLAEQPCILGSDPNCQIVIDDDSFVSLRHAEFFVDEHGRWHIKDLQSLNGIWIEVKRTLLRKATQIQLGEQRFIFKSS